MHTRVNDTLHEKMKELATKNGNTIYKEYEVAIKNHIQKEREDELLRDSKIEILINKKMDSIDKHLASMMANISKDINVLYGVDIAMARKLLDVDRKYSEEELQNYFDKKGEGIYRTRMIKARNSKLKKAKSEDGEWKE